jgi:predicted Zn-dependent protease
VNVAVNFGDRDALLQSAKYLRAQQRVREALTVLARLEEEHPGFSRLHQERGHCHVLLGDAPAAIAALREAVRINPALPTSWDMLEQLYRRRGDTARAAVAAQHLATLKLLPLEVVVANSLLADNDLAQAENVIRGYLHGDGDNVGALRLLARICMERDALTGGGARATAGLPFSAPRLRHGASAAAEAPAGAARGRDPSRPRSE